MAADTYITNVVQCGHDNDTDVIYGVVRNVAKQARDVAAGAWDTYAGADLGDYDISAGAAVGGLWSGDFPVEVDNGFYIYQLRIRAGDNPASDDILLFNLKGYWNGAIFSPSALNADGMIQADIRKINGELTNDNLATLKLKQLEVINSTLGENAVNLIAASISGHGLRCLGGTEMGYDISAAELVAIPAATITALKTMTGVSAGGTYTYAEWLQLVLAAVMGKVQDKSGSDTIKEHLDPDDGETVVIERTPAASSPYRSDEKKI